MGRILSETSFEFNGNTYDIDDEVVIIKCNNKPENIGLKGVIKKVYMVSDIHPYFTMALEPKNKEFPNQRDSYSMMLHAENKFDIKLFSKNYCVELI